MQNQKNAIFYKERLFAILSFVKNNKRKKALYLFASGALFIALLCFALSGRQESGLPDAGTAEPPETVYEYEIGISLPTTQLVYRKTMEELVFQRYSETDGEQSVHIRLLDADGSGQQQNQDILQLVNDGVDGIVLVPGSVEGCLSAIEYASEKEVPVITVDNRILESASAHVISFVGADHEKMGRDAAALFLRLLAQYKSEKDVWNVIHMTGIQETSGAIDRGRGVTEQLAGDERINLLGAYDGEFTVQNAKSVMENCLNIYDEIDGIICQNDSMAEGCAEALKDAGMEGEIVIVGIDGQASTLEMIRDGSVQGTILQDPTMILDGIESLLSYLAGEPVEPVQYKKTYPVDASNAADFLASDRSASVLLQ